jgi:flagellar hook-associated protein 3 FlgL
MRVTSNLFPDTLQQQLADIQTKQLRYQTQSATGLKINEASDNPGDYSVALNSTEDLSRMLGYVKSANEAELKLQRNHSAMTTMHSLVSRAYELAQRGNNVYNASDRKTWAVEVKDIIKQVADLANTQVDGYYLFGGTKNIQPVQLQNSAYTASSSVTPTAATPVVGFSASENINYVINSADTSITQVDVNQNYTFDTGILAGNGVSGAGSVSGFLWNGSKNILTTLKDLYSTLNSGDADLATQGNQVTDLKQSMDIISEQLGKSAAKLAALDANKSRIQGDQQLSKERVTELTEANMAEVLTQLQKTQFSYQAALQSGARILNISLLDYVQ